MKRKSWGAWIAALLCLVCLSSQEIPQSALVFQTDFGLKDGAVCAMKGVAFGIGPQIPMFDLTHEIPAFDIWAGAYQLKTTVPHWPAGTVFVSVVDPGVGTDRKSVVLKTRSGHYIVSPDNGTLTLVAEDLGIDAVREIDEAKFRRPGSEKSHTFHGRDVYAFTGAHLASGKTVFEKIGPELPAEVVMIPYQRAACDKTTAMGMIPLLDVQYGNVWTNIDEATFGQLGLRHGDMLLVRIQKGEAVAFEGRMPYAGTFGDVPEGAMLAYMNSSMNLSFAINWGNFAATHSIGSGGEWRVFVGKAE